MLVRNSKGQFVKKEVAAPKMIDILSQCSEKTVFNVIKDLDPIIHQDGRVEKDRFTLNRFDQEGNNLDQNRVWQTVGPKFHCLQAKDLLKTFQDYLPVHFSSDELQDIQVKEFSAFDSTCLSWEIHFPRLAEDLVLANLTTKSRFVLQLSTGFGTIKTTIVSKILDLVCTNGMMIQSPKTVLGGKHYENTNLGLLGHSIDLFLLNAKHEFNVAMKKIRSEVDVIVDDDLINNILKNAGFGDTAKKESRKSKSGLSRTGDLIKEQARLESLTRTGTGEVTLYDLNSALTFWSSHQKLVALKETEKDHQSQSTYEKQVKVSEIQNSDLWLSLLPDNVRNELAEIA